MVNYRKKLISKEWAKRTKMSRVQDKDTRYFIEIDLHSLKIIKCSFNQKENLNKGRQTNANVHRLFLTKGQYNKLVSCCANELATVLET
jgi:hypothetical protein